MSQNLIDNSKKLISQIKKNVRMDTLTQNFTALKSQMNSGFESILAEEYTEIARGYLKTQKKEFSKLIRQVKEVSKKRKTVKRAGNAETSAQSKAQTSSEETSSEAASVSG